LKFMKYFMTFMSRRAPIYFQALVKWTPRAKRTETETCRFHLCSAKFSRSLTSTASLHLHGLMISTRINLPYNFYLTERETNHHNLIKQRAELF
jgi:hypothetical protein